MFEDTGEIPETRRDAEDFLQNIFKFSFLMLLAF